MEIKQVNIQTRCAKTTANARYEIEYNVSDKQLITVSASVHSLSPEQNNDSYLGTITLDGDYLSCSFPYKSKSSVSKYVENFDVIVAEVKEIQSSTKITFPEK